MIGIDRRLARIALKLSKKSYSAELLYDSSQKMLFLMQDLHTVLDSAPIDMDPIEAQLSIERLLEKGFFEKKTGVWGGKTFTITPLLRHRLAFWFDAFTKKFWGGFLIGVVTGVTANLITSYVQSAIAELVQWLQLQP